MPLVTYKVWAASLLVVDDRDRQPIGRPYLTLAIDVFTRCVLGMVVTLEAPSAPIYCSQR